MKKKIAIDARFLLRIQRGMPLYVTMLCKLLPKEMPDVHFYLLINKGFEHNDSEENYGPRLSDISSLKNVTVVNEEADDEASWEKKLLPRIIDDIRPHLLHMPANRICLKCSVPQISTLHDVMEWKFLSRIHSIPTGAGWRLKLYVYRKRFYVWLNYWLGLRKLDRVLTISQYSSEQIQDVFPHLTGKIDYVYHGTPLGFTDDKEYINFDSRRGVLMFGGDSYQKNPENAIKAWANLSPELRARHPLTIAGFSGNENSMLSKTICELKFEGEVIVKKWVAEEELIRLFQQSAVFLCASREEGFGFPLLQAMACGTPTVCSDIKVFSEIGGDATLRAPAEQPEKLSLQIHSLLSDSTVWVALQNKSLERAAEFSWQETAKNIANLYRRYTNDE